MFSKFEELTKIKKKNSEKSSNPFDLDSSSSSPKSSTSKLLPEIRPELERFWSVIQWKQIGKKKIPEPISGLDEEYDKWNSVVDNLKYDLEVLLKKVRKEYEWESITYSTTSLLYRFQFEISKDEKGVISRMKENMEVSSITSKNIRFQNKELTQIVEKLIEAEENLK
jgi:DNA mismatch repair ATPase MutS